MSGFQLHQRVVFMPPAYGDEREYPGRIVRLEDNIARVAFDDGEFGLVSVSQLRLEDES